MNYTVIPARKSCNKCNNINTIDAKHCSACGASFVFGQPDAWGYGSLSDSSLKKIKELLDMPEKDFDKLIQDIGNDEYEN